jgi:serine/threonine-protein kinase
MSLPPTVTADGAARDESTLAGLVCELAGLVKAGDAAGARELIDRHPEHGAELRELLLTIARIDGVLTPEAPPPPQIDGYELLRRLGGGGQADVYKVRHESLKREVALKMIRLDRDSAAERHRLLREAQILASVKHPNVVTVHASGEHAGRVYFTMELMPASLKDRIADYTLSGAPSRAAEERIAGLLEKVARAVHHLHDRGVIHRDLKPGNILLTADDTPKVADLGIVRELDPEATRTEGPGAPGTRDYMAPEQFHRRPDLTRAVDVYALGVILYRLLTDTLPFRVEGPLHPAVDGAAEPPSARNPAVGRDSDLELICLRCLRGEPGERYPSAQALADDLARFLRREPISLRPASFLRHALTALERRPDVPLSHWSAIELWDAGLVLGAGVSAYLLIRADAHPAWLWLVLGGYIAAVWSVIFLGLRRARRLHALERDIVRLWLGHTLAILALLWVMCPPFGETRVADALRFFPGALLVTGMVFLVEGRIYWGRLYLLGLAFFAASALTPLWWQGAPLIFGTFTAASLVWLARQPHGDAARP